MMKHFIFLTFINTALTIHMCVREMPKTSQAHGIFMANEDYGSYSDVKNNKVQFKPDWNSLDLRSLPEWYDTAKLGVLLHWGVFSVPSFVTEWFWPFWEKGNQEIANFMKMNYPPNFTYADFAPMFKAELFDPDFLAQLFSQAGIKYVILTSKHHDAYALFPSKQSLNWNSVDIGPKKDLIRELGNAIKNVGLKFGVYYSLFEWQNHLYKEDKSHSFDSHAYTELKTLPDLRQLVNDYEPSVIWSDGDIEADDSYWKSKEFLAWLYNESPVKEEVVVNDRWGSRARCNHGDFFNCVDRYKAGMLVPHKWENAFSLDKLSWGYRRNINIDDVMTFSQLLNEIVTTVSCGGNVLINIGLMSAGTIAPIFQERLKRLGKWLNRNSEAIYGTSPWIYQQDSLKNFSNVWYTCKRDRYDGCNPTGKPKEEAVVAIYAIVLEEPERNMIELQSLASLLNRGTYQITILGTEMLLNWRVMNNVVVIDLPVKCPAYPVLKITAPFLHPMSLSIQPQLS